MNSNDAWNHGITLRYLRHFESCAAEKVAKFKFETNKYIICERARESITDCINSMRQMRFEIHKKIVLLHSAQQKMEGEVLK